MAVTAAHVQDEMPLDGSVPLSPLRWSDDDGHAGVVDPIAVRRDRDLGYLRSEESFAHVGRAAAAPPAPGDRMRTTGYDWRSVSRAFARRVWESHVVRVVAGHLILDRAAESGSSGSCVVNDADEIVAVNMGGRVVGTGNETVGVAVGVWGDLLELPPTEPQQ
jgi:hypothetical protein